MDLSVVVPTLNGRSRLRRCLDALAERASAAEVVVVNGPSTDGTSGLVRGHAAADRLVEIADRNVNCARNAGIAAAGGDAIALLRDGTVVGSDWADAVRQSLSNGNDAVTGPVIHGDAGAGGGPEERTIAGREVTYVEGGNVALTRPAATALDGFDEYLHTGGARDLSHRLAGTDSRVAWHPEASVVAHGDADAADRLANTDLSEWAAKYRSLSYRLTKNYGPRPTVLARIGRHAVLDGAGTLRAVLAGDATPSSWVADGRDVVTAGFVGTRDGLWARRADRSAARNPNGISDRMDRAVAQYE